MQEFSNHEDAFFILQYLCLFLERMTIFSQNELENLQIKTQMAEKPKTQLHGAPDFYSN